MHRIDTPSAVGALFTNGNPAVGQQGTQFDADWLNGIQENVAQAIEHANIALVKGDNTQLWRAIAAIAQGVLGVGGAGGTGAVATDREVLGGGLVSGGGDLTADRTLTVVKASLAEIGGGQRGDAAITPDNLATFFGPAGTDSGSVQLPGGRILKFGSYGAAIAAEGVYEIDFPVPFPTACRRVFFTPVNASASGNRDIWPQLISKAKDKVMVFAQWTGAATTQHTLDDIEYWAIGD